MKILGMGAPELGIIGVMLIPLIVIYLVTIALFVSAAKQKGHYMEGTAVPWLVGIFLSPLTLALYVCALPDRGAPVAAAPVASEPKQLEDELPAL